MGATFGPFGGLKAVFFDLDGTLVDSAADIHHALNWALNDFGLPIVDQQRVRDWVGRGASRLIHCAIHALAAPANLHAPLLQAFMQRYQMHVCVESQVYDGVLPCLEYCQSQKLHLACITNKPLIPAKKLLASLSLLDYFSLVLGGDSLDHRKPHPAPLLHGLSYYDILPDQALMIGDSRNDVEAAHAAGMACIALRYGYNHGEDIG
ncbi:MAG: phosphoglycolate phosphatase, partial [Pseudomonadota bacterium]|nr:phosphoglycolate phosphatase [Pseudomonadota bacterium]